MKVVSSGSDRYAPLALAKVSDCDIRFDRLTRQLYATDASLYQIEPVGVAFPRSAQQAVSVLAAAADSGVSVTARGAGSGLAGGAVGNGLIVDLARYNRGITDFDRERRTVRVGPGVVLDQLNAFLKPHGFWFGPDVATSSRATLGGMIANDSSGARTPVYGTTGEHVAALEIVLADGTIAVIGEGRDALAAQREAADAIVRRNAAEIADRLPPGLLKRWHGYGFDRYVRDNGDLTRLITGSEGTLALITSAEMRVVPLPAKRAMAVLFFASVAEAMQATVDLLDLGAAAIEHIDRLCFDQTRGQPAFAAARALLRLDEEPCEALLILEFFGDSDSEISDKLAALERKRLGLRTLLCPDSARQEMVWNVRKAGLNLLTACPGPAKPLPGIEDVCIHPERLPEFVNGLHSLLDPLGVEASFYGHAASGLLHVRPKLDPRTEKDIVAYRVIADGVSALCRQFRGSLASEHGVGIARTEYLPEHLGPDLMRATGEIKHLFDPKNLLNPGKIVPAEGLNYHIDTLLRQRPGKTLDLPFTPELGFVERDGSFAGNLDQCNGCGGCRKDAPTMCPTFIATGEEVMSTRGRANIIRAAVERRIDSADGNPLGGEELAIALESCLSCKACKRECPSNVDVALLKAEVTHAEQKRSGIPLKDRAIAAADMLGRLGSATAPIANFTLGWKPVRRIMESVLGIDADRPLPSYAPDRFDRWFAAHRRDTAASRGTVILWDDTWVRYHEPNIGRAAVKVLEAAGFAVTLASGRQCCGRPAMSRGVLEDARRLGTHNLALLQGGDDPILFLEASCWSMFVDDYKQLKLPGAEKVAERCVLFEEFISALLDREPQAIAFTATNEPAVIAIHAHCHAKALGNVGVLPRLVGRIPGAEVKLLETGCCGMAGAFGMMKDKQELSLAVGKPLVEKITALPPNAVVVASGTSCRHQIDHLTDAHPIHIAELLANALP